MRRIKSIILALVLTTVIAASAFAGPRNFKLVNRTGKDIRHLYISPSRSNYWEEDILGRSIFYRGRSATIVLPSGKIRYWDIRAEFEDHNVTEWHKIDMFRASKIVLRRCVADVFR